MQQKYLLPLLLSGCLSYSVSYNDDTKSSPDTSVVAAIPVDPPLQYDDFIPAARVGLNAYYFFVSGDSAEEPCTSSVTDALSSLSLENRISAVYLPEFRRGDHPYLQALPTPYSSLAAANPALQFSGWQDDLTSGLNDTVYNRNTTPTESLFFNPLGDATTTGEDWTTKGYAVVAPEDFYIPLREFVATREVMPGIQMYVCQVDITKEE